MTDIAIQTLIRERARRVGVRNAWVEFLDAQAPWDLFGTHTFPDAIHPEAADKKFRRWVSEVEQVTEREMKWVRATEPQRRGVLHYHTLLDRIAPPRRVSKDWLRLVNETMRVKWRRIAGGWHSKFLPVRPSAIRYCVKYVVKGGEVECGGQWSLSSDEIARKLAANPDFMSAARWASATPRELSLITDVSRVFGGVDFVARRYLPGSDTASSQ